jgi:hypothetical protein
LREDLPQQRRVNRTADAHTRATYLDIDAARW